MAVILETKPDHWVDYPDLVLWPRRSPDFRSSDFYLWGAGESTGGAPVNARGGEGMGSGGAAAETMPLQKYNSVRRSCELHLLAIIPGICDQRKFDNKVFT
jgi:hypothetical protein